MDVGRLGTWCNSGSGNVGWPKSHSERSYYQSLSYNFLGTAPKASIWRFLWRKLKKEKRKVVDCSSSVHFTYDPYTYEQNFDQGLKCTDADDLSGRSFSARFAAPSRIFQQNALMV